MELHTATLQNPTEILVADNITPLCELAKNLAEAGEFESACETLQPFWIGVPHRPETKGLSESSKAELLLRAGTLTGWLGSAKQIAGAQEAAKDLISESASIFEILGNTEKIAEARVDLAICYWREGALDEARVTLRLVLESLGAVQSEQKLRALLNSAIVEKVATRDHDALRIYREAAPEFVDCPNLALKGKFHNAYANLLRSLGSAEKREDYIDSALVEYSAASFHFEQVGFHSLQAIVENNVAFLFASIGKFPEAREHVNSARRLFQLKDHGGSAYTDDTLAQILLVEGNSAEAERVAHRAVKTLKQGGEQSFLAEALITHGRALARLNQTRMAKAALDQAVEISQTAGNPDRGGIAAVTAIEELSDYLPVDALQNYYRTAETLLSNSQNLSLRNRLGECARRVLSAALADADTAPTPTTEMPPLQPGFSLDSEVLRYEGSLIRRALEDAGGSVTRAARLLGVTHQGLAFILNGRHSDLLSIRTPVKRRRRSIIRHH